MTIASIVQFTAFAVVPSASNGIFSASASRYALGAPHLPLGPPKILVVEHAELLAVRSLSLNPVLGAVVCYVKLLAQQTVAPICADTCLTGLTLRRFRDNRRPCQRATRES